MNLFLNLVRRFLINHTVWMHLTLILMLSYFMIHISQIIVPRNYLLWLVGMITFSLPTLAFVTIRETKFRQRDKKYWGFWGLVFIAYPVALLLLKIDIISLPFAHELANIDINGAYTFAALSALFLVLEILLVWVNNNENRSKTQLKFGRLSVWKLSVIVVATFCIFATFASHYFILAIQNDGGFLKIVKFLYYFIQLFIIYISYYIYYYIHHNILYKSVLKKRGIIPYFFGFAMTLILLVPIHNLLISILPVVHDLKLHPMGLVDLYDDLNFGLALFVMVISFPLIVIIEWYKQANTLSELEQQKSKAELSLLRQQINPHFFFNTLNNLYSMSLTDDKQTPETILQLSEMMRYVIYKGKEEKVKLKDEVKYMKDYINLQMIRVHKTVDLKVDFDIENDDLKISPLMFIILLENAFKHGIEPAGHESKLYISMKDINEAVVFECYNSKPTEIQEESNAGIGLSNLKKRLQIVYPEQHELIIVDEFDSYKATLKIHL